VPPRPALPTISRRNPVFGAWLDNAMRAGIPDDQVREQTIMLYLDKLAFRAALGLPHEQTIYLPAPAGWPGPSRVARRGSVHAGRRGPAENESSP
jgi:hypothetical protein